MATKKLLGRTIVAEFHGQAAALEAEATFERTVQRKEAPADIPEIEITEGEPLIDVLVRADVAPSRREARRLFEQRAVTMDEQVVDALAPAQTGSVVQVGKRRWLRLV